MKQAVSAVFLLLLLVLFTSQSSAAQELASMDDAPTIGLQGGKFGVGFSSAYPSYGPSGTLQLNEKITVEAILGFLGVINNYGGRVWYRFKIDQTFDLYAVGGVNAFRFSNRFFNENVIGFSVGAGAESGLQALLDDPEMPPVFFNAELGLGFANFNRYGGFNLLSFGVGVHYRFGQF